MFFADLLVASVIALLLTLVFAAGFRRVGPWGGVVWFFLLLMLAAWAGGVWTRPIGPAVGGVYWLSFLWFGLLIALILAAAEPAHRFPAREEQGQAPRRFSAGSWFLWLAALALAAAILANYLFAPPMAGTPFPPPG